MSKYKIFVTRWAEGWEIEIRGVGVTQSRTLQGVENVVRDYLQLDGHADASEAELDVQVSLDGLEQAAADSRTLTEEAAKAQREAASKSRKVAKDLRDHGLSVADTAVVLGVSKGRVSQLVN